MDPDAPTDAPAPICISERVRALPIVACANATFPGRLPSGVISGSSFPYYGHFAVGDLNGDGRLDVVDPSEGAPLDVFLGTAQGPFAPPIAQGPATYWRDLGLGDFDGNGTLDLATVTESLGGGDRAVSIMLGAGNGTFAAPVALTTTDGWIRLEVGDIDSDGKPDILATRPLSGTISVFHNLGGATFAPPVALAAGTAPDGPQDLVLADVDGDGRLDIVSLFTEHVGIIQGTSSGFAPVAMYATGSFGDAITTADLDGDGLPEIVVAGSSTTGGGGMSILKKSATGFVATLRSLPARATSVTVGDLDQDGDRDMIVGHGSTAPVTGTSVLLNAGGVLGSATAVDTGRGNGVALADLDGDTKLDVIVNGDFLVWYRGTGNGGFVASTSYTLGDAQGVIAHDIDGDQHIDLLGVGANLTIARGNGDGTFGVDQYPTVPNLGSDLAIADFDDDGILDVAVASYRGRAPQGAVLVFWGGTGGTFPSNTTHMTTAPGTSSLAVGDVNGDCHPDLIIGNGGFRDAFHGIYDPGSTDAVINMGQRAFAPAIKVGPEARKVLLGDLDADGYLDLVAESEAGNTVARGVGNAIFVPGVPLDETALAQLVDVNHDGKLDLVATAGVRLGRGDRTFAPRASNALRGTLLGDVDGDGELDFKESLNVLAFGNGDGAAKRRIFLRWIGDVSGDFNGDGLVDLAGAGKILFQECPP